VLVAEDEAGALQEDRGDLFFTTSVENREFPLYIGHYPGTRTGTPTRDARGCPLGVSEDHPKGISLLLPFLKVLGGRPRAAPITLCVTGETVEEQERGQPR
jgi:hypothetical protein